MPALREPFRPVMQESWEERQRRERMQRAKRQRRGDTLSLVGIVVFLLVWLVCVALPLVLMIAAIRWLWLNA